MRKLILATVALVLVAALAGVVPRAAADSGPELQIAVTADRQERTLDVTWHAVTGQFLTTWSEHPSHSVNGAETHNGDDTIWARLINLDGNPAGARFQVSSGGGSKDFPQVAHVGNTVDPADEVSMVVWADSRDGSDDIWAQLIAPAGNALQGGNFKVSGEADNEEFPHLAYGPTDRLDGVYLVVWERMTSATDSDVWGRLVRGGTSSAAQNPGDLVGSAFRISEPTTGWASAPDVAFDPINDQFLVVWGDDRGIAGDEREIWAQRVDTAGGLVGANFRVSGRAGFERAPIVRYHPEQQEYLVVWEYTAVFATHQFDVLAQRISPAGALVGGVITVKATGLSEEPGEFDIVAESGRYVIPINTADRSAVEIQRLRPDGTLVGGAEQVATDTSANKGPASAAYGSTVVGPGAGQAALSEVFVVWRDSRAGGDSVLHAQDVWGRMVERQSDTDGDGLLDSWEQNGYVDLNDNGVLDAGDLDFGAFPAADRPDWRHKDIYVEIDWMQVDTNGDGQFTLPGEHTHELLAGLPGSQPTGTSLDEVVTAFANSPVANPDGVNGIDLHLDVGQLGGGNALAEQLNIDFFRGFEAIKRTNFAPNRERVFHYALIKHEGGGRAEIWGNDLWFNATTRVEQAVTFMHEFGHNLGLRHGGGDNLNGKPNYFSIMSYNYSLTGIPPNFRIDYSAQVLPTLDEGNLNESVTLGDGNDQAIFSAGAVVVGPNANTAGNVAIDWDNDGTANESGAAVGNNDLNDHNQHSNAGPNEVFTGFDDWRNLRYNFHSSPNFDDNIHLHDLPDVGFPAGVVYWRAFYGPPALSLTKTGPAEATPGDAVTYSIDVANTGSGPARYVRVTDTWPAGITLSAATPAPLTDVLNPDGSRTLAWIFDPVAAGASVGISLSGTVDFPPTGHTVANDAGVTAEDVAGVAVAAQQASVTTQLLFPELSLLKTATPSVPVGEAVTYTLTYENAGSGDATDVVLTDVLPAGLYYSAALDLGDGPQPDTVIPGPLGVTVLTWHLGTVPAGSGPFVVEFTARPSLLFVPGTAIDEAGLAFADTNGNVYPTVDAAAATAVTAVTPTGDPRSLGYFRTHPEHWTAETLARIQATDTRFDGAGDSPPDGALSTEEVESVLTPGGGAVKVLRMQLLATYFNLAEWRIGADTRVMSHTAARVGLGTVRQVVLYARATLTLPLDKSTAARYDDAILLLDEINTNRSLVY